MPKKDLKELKPGCCIDVVCVSGGDGILDCSSRKRNRKQERGTIRGKEEERGKVTADVYNVREKRI